MTAQNQYLKKQGKLKLCVFAVYGGRKSDIYGERCDWMCACLRSSTDDEMNHKLRRVTDISKQAELVEG